MRTALRTIWTDEFEQELERFSSLAKQKFAEPGSENVVRPQFNREPSPTAIPDRKPQLSGALDAVLRASDVIKAAQDRAAVAEDERRELDRALDSATRRAEEAERRLAEAGERALVAEERLVAMTARAGETIAAAQADLDELRAHADEETRRADAAEARAEQQSTERQVLVRDAHERFFAAETRARDLQDDLAYLETHIREQFRL